MWVNYKCAKLGDMGDKQEWNYQKFINMYDIFESQLLIMYPKSEMA